MNKDYNDKIYTDDVYALIFSIPKAELHVHIEGTLEPEMMVRLAKKNGVDIPYKTAEEARQAYDFEDLQSFLDVYYTGASVLVDESDFYELTRSYLARAHLNNVKYAEIFFDPQTHTNRGIPFETVIKGITEACDEAREFYGLDTKLIMCFLRHLPDHQAMMTLQESLPFKDMIYGVGLDSSEVDHPPSDFVEVFREARKEGYACVAHAGEEGPAGYIWSALKDLGAERIDHGVRCMDDFDLVKHLAAHQIPLTVCPLSNVKLKVFDKMEDHNILDLLDMGVLVSVNSDDPPYFGGYLNANFFAMADELGLTEYQVTELAKNSFKSAFLDDEMKDHYIGLVDDVATHREIY